MTKLSWKVKWAQFAASQGKLAVIRASQPVSKFIKNGYSSTPQEHRLNQPDPLPPRPRYPDQNFTLFPQLSRELQLCIWKHALMDSEPRAIIIKSENIYSPIAIHESAIPDRYQARAYCDIPASMQVCRLARIAGLERYPLTFRANLIHPVYFDSWKDYLIVEGDGGWRSFVYHGLTHESVIKDRLSGIVRICSGGWHDIKFY